MQTRDRHGSNVRALPTPSHSLPAEQALLGSLLLESSALAQLGSRVVGADFYEPRHALIFRTIYALHANGLAADVVTVSEHLEKADALEEAGGLAYIGQLANDTPTAANIETYAKIVREHAQRRRVRTAGVELVRMIDASPERSPADLVSEAQERLLGVQERLRVGRGLVEASRLAGELLDDLDRRSRGERGLSIGLADFDAATHGLDPGDLVVIAGRPSIGKTALLVSIAAHVARESTVAVFSAEMPARQLMRRAVALVGDVSQARLRDPQDLEDTEWSRITKSASAVGRLKLHIDETPSPALEHIRAECLTLKAREPLGLVLVDYVQLVAGRGANRYEQLRDVAYGLKALAKDLRVPIIVLAQLNRGVESRDQKRAQVSDLRDSGAIEEAADVVGILYNEARYTPGFQMPDVLECNIEKNRNGERAQCLWQFDGARSRTTLLDSASTAQYRRLLAAATSRSGRPANFDP